MSQNNYENKKVSLKEVNAIDITDTLIFSGPGSIGAVSEILLGLNCKRPLVVSDKGITKVGTTARVVDAINFSDEIEIAGVFDDISNEAGILSIIECLKAYKENNADGIVGVGGGSVLDAVKFIKWMVEMDYNTVEDVFNHYGDKRRIYAKWPEAKRLSMPLVAIPTAAGTGTEVSGTSVIHDDTRPKAGHIVRFDPFVAPDAAILDAYVTVSLPKHLTAGTGFDAFNHSLEAYFSSRASMMSDAFAIESMKAIEKYLPIAVNEPGNIEARQKMLEANVLGIYALALAIAEMPIHKITLAFANHERHHGLSNAHGMTATMTTIPEFYLPRIREFAEDMGFDNIPDDDNAVLDMVVEWLADLRTAAGVPEKFENFTMTEEQVEEFVQLVRNEDYDLEAEKVKETVRKMVEIVG